MYIVPKKYLEKTLPSHNDQLLFEGHVFNGVDLRLYTALFYFRRTGCLACSGLVFWKEGSAFNNFTFYTPAKSSFSSLAGRRPA
jgi:hypothetical protein